MMAIRKIIFSSIALALGSFGGLAVFGANATEAVAEASAVEQSATQSLFSGVWTKKSFKSSGTWEIYSDSGKTFIKLSDDFKTRKAPDLKIFLSPLEASQANGKNATDGSVLIAPLSSNAGEQVYEIPEGVDFAQLKSVLIHCEAYSKLWSASDLS